MENDRIVKMYLHMIMSELDIIGRLLGAQVIGLNNEQRDKVIEKVRNMKATAFLNALSLLGDSPQEKKIKEELEKRQKEAEKELEKSFMFG